MCQSLGSPRVATLLIEDDGDAPGAANPIDNSDTFVCQHYHDFLNREPDDAGRAFWTNNIESCGADQQCREVKRIDTSAAFFLSIESQETGFFVYRLYQTAFARAPVPIRFEQFLRDALKVREGVVVGAPGWPERLEANKRAFLDEFVAAAGVSRRLPRRTHPDHRGVRGRTQREHRRLALSSRARRARRGLARRTASTARRRSASSPTTKTSAAASSRAPSC